jgi:hypothetical protein
MSQWGRPKHSGLRHNRRIRGGGTWSEQDQRLRRHKKARLRARRGGGLWGEQVNRLDRERRQGERAAKGGMLWRWRYVAAVIAAIFMLSIAPREPVLAVFAVAALLVITRRAKGQRR